MGALLTAPLMVRGSSPFLMHIGMLEHLGVCLSVGLLHLHGSWRPAWACMQCGLMTDSPPCSCLIEMLAKALFGWLP